MDNTDTRIIQIYTDGSSLGNPGPGGAGIVMLSGNLRREFSVALGRVTNNVAELSAIKIALEKIKRYDYTIYLYTDSKYAMGVLNGSYHAHKNQDLIGEIRNMLQKIERVYFRKVEAHSGVCENECADRLATKAAKKSAVGIVENFR